MAVLLLVFSLLAVCSAQFKDDLQTYETECLMEGSFSCTSGACIPSEKYCDGYNDCEDGGDENFCANHRPDAHLCNETHQFLCTDGLMCLPSSWVCNYENDCKDGSDEMGCEKIIQHDNSSCKGFQCDGGKLCISDLWMCDGYYDCADKTDEDVVETCHHAPRPKHLHDTLNCEVRSMNYTCLDKSYCVPYNNMCDGLKDCRDGSDEGAFCAEWSKMCANRTCPRESFCKPTRNGGTCVCNSYKEYNPSSGECERSRQCLQEVPVCSHMCEDMGDYFKCTCEDGYRSDHAQYLCFAPGPEAMLFFSTQNSIQYVTVKSNHSVSVLTGIKKAHGVAYDGKYLYWVETEKGHQAIMKAQLEDVAETKQVLAALGLEDPGDIAVDYLGDNIYFSDTARGCITVCRTDGALCVTLAAHTRRPKFVTLDPRKGVMYWADKHDKPVIMKAKMDGSESENLVHELSTFAKGLALDAPNGRLYFVDGTIKVVILNDKRVYSFFEEQFHHPYSLSVFENTIFWSDWTSRTIQTADKIHGTSINRNILLTLDTPVFDMHLYHPILTNATHNPCSSRSCPLCLITSNTSSVCACPDSMRNVKGHCEWIPGYRPDYLLVASGSAFIRIYYDTVGNPETHSTVLDIGRVQAMAYDNFRDTLYIYDGQHKSINSILMSDFSLGVTHLFMYKGLENVVDMDYDYVSDSLYILDAGRRVIEVVSLKNKHTALLYRFREEEIPISFCVLSAYGRMLVAVLDTDNDIIYIDSFGLDGDDRKHIVTNNTRGPNIRMRYSTDLDVVFLSDDQNGVIDFLHPQGTGRENFREVVTNIASLAVTDNQVFWTDKRSTKLYWADMHDATRKIRRIELSIFPNTTHLVILATSPLPKSHGHTCSNSNPPCSHICVQKSHEYVKPGSIDSAPLQYTCLCPVGFINNNGICYEVTKCKEHEFYCHKSNQCFDGSKKCDGTEDCKFGEDEEGCLIKGTYYLKICEDDEIDCHGICIQRTEICRNNTTKQLLTCGSSEFRCSDNSICIERALACDGHADCRDASDEHPDACDTRECGEFEYMCASGSCIPLAWKCDKHEDCLDGSDEISCESRSCPSGTFECDTGCVEVYKRCDGKYDCEDHEDERDCDEPEFAGVIDFSSCAPWEYRCEHNKSICLPQTARCNGRTDCPGGSDEAGCNFQCGELFPCTQEHWCVYRDQLCDGRQDCADGSDETFDVCARANKTRPLTQTPPTPCEDYRCDDGQCLPWEHVCDDKAHCRDGSDENGLCNSTCAAGCISRRTPRGPRCSCRSVCEECSHTCHTDGETSVCACYKGYGLRLDRRSCKALYGAPATLYSRGGAAWSLTSHVHTMLYHEGEELSDLDCDVRRGKLYFTSSEVGKLIEVDNKRQPPVKSITNIGRPGKLSADWITGNVYFADSTPSQGSIRVCNFKKQKCAKLQKIPTDVQVTALVTDPANHLLFYCLSDSSESHIRSSSMSGRSPSDVATVPACLGLAVNSFSKLLYISTPSSILKVGYDGSNLITLIDHPISTPHLAFFEDYIYFIHNSHVTRCLHFGPKTCETLSHVYNASNFVLSHESIQRDDVINSCDVTECGHVCVLDRVAVCVCHDGSIVRDGVCPGGGAEEAVFSDGSHSHVWSLTFLWVLLLMLAVYAAAFVHYRLYRKNKTPAEYIQVRYHNTSEGLTHLSHPIIDVPEAGAMSHEFVNPLQFVRNFWRESFERQKPIGSNVMYEEQHDPSDTESDLDVRETRRMIK
ncbi:vitellogenin receptor isoform X2 [Danaus plexippus]|uniref:vitellogenin receptor isoform X2 n=1 Tax=Danaus plexippus TaxID=13037 RepID=UPI002AB220F2|nr:vitellogenin receptor isoform X2 [Danaus plexippus]